MKYYILQRISKERAEFIKNREGVTRQVVTGEDIIWIDDSCYLGLFSPGWEEIEIERVDLV